MRIHSNIRDYEVFFPETADFVREFGSFPNRFYVIDENVWKLHGNGILADLRGEDKVILPISEDRKNLDSVQSLYQELMGYAAKKNMTLISIGGGILQDITGFVASTLYRGINWIFTPTTLLAQSDSCIGSKTSLNHRNYKNLIGTFYPPAKVYIHTPFLQTQETVDFNSGLGEVVKLHIMGGAGKVRIIRESLAAIIAREPSALTESIRESLQIKLSYIADDEFDTGRRNLLNYGHCFGHAIESVSRFEIPHGQAVVLGILLANRVARFRNLLPASLEEELAQALLRPALSVRPEKKLFDPDLLIESMKKDKKRTGEGLALIMLLEDYSLVRINDLTAPEALKALDSMGW